MKGLATAISALTCLALTACGTSGTYLFTPRKITTESGFGEDAESRTVSNSAMDFFGPDPIIDRARIEPINLLFMLDPKGRAQMLYEDSPKKRPRPWNKLTLDEKYEWGFHAFYDPSNNVSAGFSTYELTDIPAQPGTSVTSSAKQTAATTKSGEAEGLAKPCTGCGSAEVLKLRRNRIQQRLLLASNERCGIYQRLIFQIQSDSQFWTGSLGTISGVLGALLGGQASRNLAATAGIFSGVGAEFSQAYYANLAANVINKGIEERRKAIHSRIAESQNADIARYTVQAAVKDAVFYDSQCSVIAGLEEAQDAIRLAAEPGMDAAMRMMAKQKVAAKLIAADEVKDIKTLADDFASLKSTSLLGGDRFSNVGVPVTSTTQARRDLVASDFASLKVSTKAKLEGLAADLQSLAGKAIKDVKRLKTDDGKTPASPIGAFVDFSNLYDAFNTKVDACSAKLIGDYANKLTEAAKVEEPVKREEKYIETDAVRARMRLIHDELAAQYGRIAGIRTAYLALPFSSLVGGSLDESKTPPDDLPVKSLAALTDAQGGKIVTDYADVTKTIGALCN